MSNTAALVELIAIDAEAQDFGFEWPDADMILDQVISECHEIRQSIEQQNPPSKTQEEIGDLLHAAISLCVFAGFEVEDTLQKSAIKLGSRMQMLQQIARERGLSNLKDKSIDFKMQLWNEAKVRLS